MAEPGDQPQVVEGINRVVDASRILSDLVFGGGISVSANKRVSTAIQAERIGDDSSIDELLLPGEEKDREVGGDSSPHWNLDKDYFVQRGDGTLVVDEVRGTDSTSGLNVGDKLVARAKVTNPPWATSEWTKLSHGTNHIHLTGNVSFPSMPVNSPVRITGHLLMPSLWLTYGGDAATGDCGGTDCGANRSGTVDTNPIKFILLPETWRARAIEWRVEHSGMTTVLTAYAILIFLSSAFTHPLALLAGANPDAKH